MTTTTRRPPSTTHAGHPRPCFCDACLGVTLLDLVDERAVLLHGAVASRSYTDGLERELAEELIAGIPADRRGAALEVMATEHLSPHITGAVCVLDECDERTYTAISSMARVLLDAVTAQDRAPAALRVLLTQAICDTEGLLPVSR